MGKIDSGIATYSKYASSSATRVQLPCPFAWPVRTFNLKRCLLITRIPVEGGKELVIVNLHLEAYDDGEGKAAQAKMLMDVFSEETAKGNYVIAGGDFNQTFDNVEAGAYPLQEGKWAPGRLETGTFGEGWQFLMNSDVPSCRSLDQPYAGSDKESFQYYAVDGFIVSDNVSVKDFHTLDEGFVCTDHNPVRMEFVLE
jgi:endonuclease/exonuclease/phosphatase family metal-dependent hydrolase